MFRPCLWPVMTRPLIRSLAYANVSAARRRARSLDAAQVVTSSASSALFEGIADNGMFFLDWIEGPEDELGVALQRLRGALRCNAAWAMHEEGKTLDEIVPVIAEGGFQDSVTARSRLAFLSHRLRAPFVYAYWCGDMAVHNVWATVRPEHRTAFWDFLFSNMHTPATLARHWQPPGKQADLL